MTIGAGVSFARVRVLRTVAVIATLVALLALGAALGDFASDPSPLGALGLLVVVAGIGVALARLYGPRGVREPGPAVSRAVAASPQAPRRRPKARASVVEEAWGPRAEPEAPRREAEERREPSNPGSLDSARSEPR